MPKHPAHWTDDYVPLASMVPYVVRTRMHARHWHPPRLPITLAHPRIFDPGDVGAAPFLERLEALDHSVYGPRGLALPRWALYDTAEVPGVVVGLASAARDLTDVARAALGVRADSEGLVPLSACILAPTMEPDAHWCSALASVNQIAPGAARSALRRVSLVFALEGLRARTLYVATQWRSSGLPIYSSLGPSDILAAYTPAHTHPATAVLRCTRADRRWSHALSPPRGIGGRKRLLDVDDEGALRALQSHLEAGGRARLVGVPLLRGARVLVPIQGDRP